MKQFTKAVLLLGSLSLTLWACCKTSDKNATPNIPEIGKEQYYSHYVIASYLEPTFEQMEVAPKTEHETTLWNISLNQQNSKLISREHSDFTTIALAHGENGERFATGVMPLSPYSCSYRITQLKMIANNSKNEEVDVTDQFHFEYISVEDIVKNKQTLAAQSNEIKAKIVRKNLASLAENDYRWLSPEWHLSLIGEAYAFFHDYQAVRLQITKADGAVLLVDIKKP